MDKGCPPVFFNRLVIFSLISFGGFCKLLSFNSAKKRSLLSGSSNPSKEKPILDKRQLSIVEGSDLLDIVKPIGQNSINISVIVEQNNFEVVGGKYWGTIDVPLAVIDSKPLIFILKPYKEGLNKIVIHFIQLGIPS